MSHILSLKGKSDKFDWWVITLVASPVAQVALVFASLVRYDQAGTNWLLFIGLLALGATSIWAMIAVTAKRFKDINYSPWLTLIYLVPVVGWIFIWIVCGFSPIHKRVRRKIVTRKVSNGDPILKMQNNTQ